MTVWAALIKTFVTKGLRALAWFTKTLGSVVVALAIASYHPHDPTPNMATQGETLNLLGPWGALMADMFIQTMGWATYVLATLWLLWTLQRLIRAAVYPPFLRWAALMAMIASLTWLSASQKAFAGGVLGEWMIHLCPPDIWIIRLLMMAITLISGVYVVSLRMRHLERAFTHMRVLYDFMGVILTHYGKKMWGVLKTWKNHLSLLIETYIHVSPPPSITENVAPSALSEPTPPLSEVRETAPPPKATVLPHTPPKTREPSLKKEEPEETLSLSDSFLAIKKRHHGSDPAPCVPHADNLPSLDLLHDAAAHLTPPPATELEEQVKALMGVLKDFGIAGQIQKARPGPVVTLYELELAPGIKSSRVVSLADDIARSMSALATRVSVIPGRNIIGIELPNKERETVFLKEVLSHKTFVTNKAHLPLALGKNIAGDPVTVDLAQMPHLLVAGTTGSGKSVGINTMILSLLFRLPPESCQLLMIDPKMLELSVYNDIPHLITPVIVDPKKAVQALKWAVHEMEQRYKSMSAIGVRNIDSYNKKIEEARRQNKRLTQRVKTGFDEDGMPIVEERELPETPLPYIVIVVDEMADLMLVAGKEIEGAIQRLAQMARAAGIHLIMATQRPSVDVLTGTIKANFPTRLSFQVTSKIDSRTILGEQGAEQLLGRGDMLYMPPGDRMQRVHGPFVSDAEVEAVVSFLKSTQADHPASVVFAPDDSEKEMGGDSADENDDLFQEAVRLVLRDKKASTSYIQRRFQIGYNRAARLMEDMEAQGIVSPPNHAGKRTILREESA
ncbi:cell division protein FtsK [bacterium NHP-B]|nr:cell division protein FtsK [bacterium NHP-B]